ncbi:ankyrin repeat protein/ketosteroid isomerase-like protein [Chryseobacterium sp. W4I1]|nr:ankyrin repeat protein/ketosteroid isomerase-like protein [Chryseobacterium sp. W4I1]
MNQATNMLRLFITIIFIISNSIVYGKNKNRQIKKQIKMSNAKVLHQANEFVKKGDYESFLAYCTEDSQWTFIGERILKGKEEVRKYMKEFYWEPPVFTVETTIEEGNFVTVTGEISLKTKDGILNHYQYCDVWRFENGKMAGVKAYVIEKKISTAQYLHQNQFNLLGDAVDKNDLCLVESLLKNGVNADLPNSKGLTPLMLASGLGHIEIVKLLITHGADILAVDPNMGATALHKASQSGHPKIIELLLEEGAFIDMQSPIVGNSPLMDAILYKQEASVKILLEHNARIELRNNFNESVLDMAHQLDNASMISVINEYKNNLEKKIQSQKLVKAITQYDIKNIKVLIDGGIDINERIPKMGNYNDDFTPLSLAASKGYDKIVRLLLDSGADITMLSGLMGATVLHEAAYAGHVKVIEILMQYIEKNSIKGIDINAQGLYNGMTALHDAVWQNNMGAVKILVDKGADLSLTSHSGLTPLEFAELYNYSEIILFLKDVSKTSYF